MSSVVSLAALVGKGGVYYNIAGTNPAEVLKESSRALVLPRSIDREAFLKAILEREALMPTAIGNGVAIPHPRNPMIEDAGIQMVAALFLKTPVAWNALDRKPVSVLFVILSADARSHLGILAAISHLCQRKDFQDLLAARPSTEELTSAIRKIETSWAPANS
jgi:PTS system nitrogen regulatory IIA component